MPVSGAQRYKHVCGVWCFRIGTGGSRLPFIVDYLLSSSLKMCLGEDVVAQVRELCALHAAIALQAV